MFSLPGANTGCIISHDGNISQATFYKEAQTLGLKPYIHITMAMIRTGVLGYGGGPSVIPLFHHEAVNRYKWVSDKEFSDILAFANTLPGPIATKMAADLGYRLKGSVGAIVAIIAHIFPTTFAMVGLLAILYTLKESVIVAGIIAAVRPVIAVLLGMMAYDFCMHAWEGLGRYVAILFIVIAFFLLAIVEIHPAITIIMFLLYGTIHIRLSNRIAKRREKYEAK